MNANGIKKLKSIKTLIIPKLPINFHESLFFSEIQYQTNPSKQLKKYLINLYIQGIDYYSAMNQTELSLYFQTKLIDIMKRADYFEKISSKKYIENDFDTLVESRKRELLIHREDIENNWKKNIKEQIDAQHKQFSDKLRIKRNLMKFKRLNSVNPVRKSYKSKLSMNSKISNLIQLKKKGSINLSTSFRQSVKNKQKSDNSIFSKIENGLNGLDRINTLLIIEYTKKLKHFMKKELQIMHERINKYNEYMKNINEFNLIYEEIEDKTEDDAKCIKEQIDLYKKEWEQFDKKTIEDNDVKFSEIVKLEDKNLDNFVDNLYKKIEDIKINEGIE